MDGASCWGLSGRVVEGSAGGGLREGLHPCGQVQGQGDDGARRRSAATALVGGEAVQGECGQGGQYAAGAEYALIVYDDAGGTEEAAT